MTGTETALAPAALPRVLHLHFGKEGGAERFFVSLVNALGRRGVDQRFVIRPNRSWRGEIADLGPLIENNYSRISPLSPLLEWQVRRLCREWQPDAIMAWIPRAARLIPDWPGAVKLARLGDFPKNLKHFGRCDLLVGNLPGIGTRCRDLGWTKPLVTISNFPRPIKPVPVTRASQTTPEDAFLLVAGGRFVPRKGMDVAIRAAAEVPGAWLWLLGDGNERPMLESLARELGIADRVRFVGWVAEPIHHLAAADVFLMPSRHEPLGNMLLEAWQAGVPSVSTRSEGPDWFMRDGIDGLVTPIDDVAAMAAAIRRLRADPALAQGFAENASGRLDEMFSEHGVVDAYLRVFAGELPFGA
ncbi:glycosyltransferase [Paracoccaceae bacterium Fryx2]|nr:glycosyltransferase [Paracoccaceae bacterium Fryx2]